MARVRAISGDASASYFDAHWLYRRNFAFDGALAYRAHFTGVILSRCYCRPN